MADPVLHLIVGPNGSGKSTFYEHVVFPVTNLPFVNADVIAAERWPDEAIDRAYDAAALAADERSQLIAERRSFATETVFSHPSKLELVDAARQSGYVMTLHVVVVPVALALARVENRVLLGGHSVPEEKVRARFGRLWRYVKTAIELVDEAKVYDNSRATPSFRIVARYRNGYVLGSPVWPGWIPDDVRSAGL
jgi:predicted ABC-type ATPase